MGHRNEVKSWDTEMMEIMGHGNEINYGTWNEVHLGTWE